ncbi:MAG: N-acetyltransferase [Actinomyces sp.]|nr:MAG: N-acetyltransferase [Actinomyces sp.]
MAEPPAFVHPTADVEEGATIGSGTAVWRHCHIRTGARIGSGCNLGKNVFVDRGVVIGDGCKLQNNVNVYEGVSLEDRVFVGPSATFTNDLIPRAFIENWELVPTSVREGASIGAHATIVCGVELGAYCMVAAGATVVRDVAAHELVGGTPAVHLGWVCRCGRVVSRDAERPERLECGSCADTRR